MKAAQLVKYGEQDAVVVQAAGKPVAGADRLVVEVYAAGINPFDYKVRGGYIKDSTPLELPKTMGFDMSGVVVDLGPNIKEFSVGQAVYGQADFYGGSGSFAEFALAKPEKLSAKPVNATHDEAASLPLAGVSALQAVMEHLNLQPGQKILIHGGAGGIGSLAVQIAKSIGAHVTATVMAAEFDFAKRLGADELIDYTTQKFEDGAKDFDAVFDTAGGETAERSYQVIKPGGRLVSMTTPANPDLEKQYGVTAIHQHTQVTHHRLFKLAELVEAGAIKPNIDKTYPLEQTPEAMQYLKTDHPKGKVIIHLKA